MKGRVRCHPGHRGVRRRPVALTFNAEEAGGFKLLSSTGVRPGVVRSTAVDEQRPLAAIRHHLVFLSLADLLAISEPDHLSVVSGHLAFKSGSGLLLHRLVLQRLGELYRWF